MAPAMKCLILMLFTQTAFCYVTMPVIIMDPIATLRAGVVSANPFNEMASNSFTEIIHDAVHLSESILVFVEDKFSVEDISSRDVEGTPYRNLHQNFLEEKAKYLPSVVDPLRTLQQLLPPLETNVVYVKDTVKNFDKKFKYHYMYFVDSNTNETRIQKLRRHDEMMKQAFDKLRADHTGPVVMFYTGKTNEMIGLGRTGWERQDTGNPADGKLMVTSKALIRLTGVTLHQDKMRTPLVPTAATAQSFGRKRGSTRMLYDDYNLDIDFNFEYLRDEWILDSVVLLEGGEEVGRTPMGVGAPYDWSYFCSEPLVIVNTRDKSYVTISKYQLEPLRRKGEIKSSKENADGSDLTALREGGKAAFRNSVNCGTNFNCRILAGLFVVFMVVSITLYGVMMLFDCASNDRMDDANQKPLVIVAQL